LGVNQRRARKFCTLPYMGATKGLDYGRVSSGIETPRMPGPYHPLENHILAALPQPERDRLFPYLKLVPLPLGKVLYESGDTLRHIYFPTDSIISLLYVLNDGASAEIAVVGNEGAIGVALFMGGETTTTAPSCKALAPPAS
jgi:hypothetical protein